ncbi:hypothetical protein F4604DRAFT_1909915 [Suillus subluteus]|nr:hypothetical protein F4604DRAFT_1909915 [Suillus subluteus]
MCPRQTTPPSTLSATVQKLGRVLGSDWYQDRSYHDADPGDLNWGLSDDCTGVVVDGCNCFLLSDARMAERYRATPLKYKQSNLPVSLKISFKLLLVIYIIPHARWLNPLVNDLVEFPSKKHHQSSSSSVTIIPKASNTACHRYPPVPWGVTLLSRGAIACKNREIEIDSSVRVSSGDDSRKGRTGYSISTGEGPTSSLMKRWLGCRPTSSSSAFLLSVSASTRTVTFRQSETSRNSRQRLTRIRGCYAAPKSRIWKWGHVRASAEMSASVSMIEVEGPGESTRVLRPTRLWCTGRERKSKEEDRRRWQSQQQYLHFSVRMTCSSVVFVWMRDASNWDQVLAGM